MKRILFSTEFSEHAPHVFRFAIEFAHALDAEVVAMHGYGKPEVRAVGESAEAKEKKVVQRLESFIDQHLPEDAQARVVPMAEFGYPAEAVLSAARKVDAELIVVGMVGSNRPSDRQIGSTAKEIIRKAGPNRMVLAVPADARFTDMDKVAFFTRFEFKDLRALGVLKDLADNFNSTVEIVHVIERSSEREEAEKNMETLQRLLSGYNFIEYKILQGDPKKVLKEHVQDKGLDLVAMLSHKHTFLGRLLDDHLSTDMVGELSVPLLAFRS